MLYWDSQSNLWKLMIAISIRHFRQHICFKSKIWYEKSGIRILNSLFGTNSPCYGPNQQSNSETTEHKNGCIWHDAISQTYETWLSLNKQTNMSLWGNVITNLLYFPFEVAKAVPLWIWYDSEGDAFEQDSRLKNNSAYQTFYAFWKIWQTPLGVSFLLLSCSTASPKESNM